MHLSRRRLIAIADGELPAGGWAARHYRDCDRCREQVRTVAEERRALEQAGAGLPADPHVERGLAALVGAIRSEGEALASSNRPCGEFLGSRAPDRASAFSVPWWIAWLTAVTGAVCIGGTLASFATGNMVWLDVAFRYPGALFLICLAAAELRLTAAVRERFAPGDTMRAAWTLIVVAAAAHYLGELLTQVFTEGCVTHPALAMLPGADRLRLVGIISSGPLRFALLAAGLALVVRAALRAGLLPRLAIGDSVLVLAAGGLAALQLSDAVRLGSRHSSAAEMASLWTGPLMVLVAIQAVLLRRMLRNVGWRRLARCWTAIAGGSLLTMLGHAGTSVPGSWSATQWFVWFFAGAAFVLAPTFQLQAARDTVPLCRSELPAGVIPGELASHSERP
jgi:hypothetical protein